MAEDDGARGPGDMAKMLDAAPDTPQGGRPGTDADVPGPRPRSAYDEPRPVARLRAAPPDAASALAPDWAARQRDPSLFDEDPEADPEAELRALGGAAGRNGWVLWVMGGAAILAGLLALAMPLVSSLAASVFVATMLLASGAVGLVTSFRNRAGTDQAMGFALSALSVVAGAVMLIAPLAGIVALGSLIIAFFAASGALKIWYGLKHHDAKGRGWLIAAGALSLILALFLWTGLPEAALWLPGVLLALELVMTGTLLIALAIWGEPRIEAPE